MVTIKELIMILFKLTSMMVIQNFNFFSMLNVYTVYHKTFTIWKNIYHERNKYISNKFWKDVLKSW